MIVSVTNTSEKPLKTLYLTGLVRDKQSVNVKIASEIQPDALKLIADYWIWGRRPFVVGLFVKFCCWNGLMFDEELWVEQGQKTLPINMERIPIG